jgi:hypothetical protein
MTANSKPRSVGIRLTVVVVFLLATTLTASIIELLAENPTLADRTGTDKHLTTLANVMRRNPLYYGIYMGHADGSFYELVNLDTSETARKSLRAIPADK